MHNHTYDLFYSLYLYTYQEIITPTVKKIRNGEYELYIGKRIIINDLTKNPSLLA